MTLDEIRAYLTAEFPQVFARPGIAIDRAEDGFAALHFLPGEDHLRPGRIVSGPTLMMLADAAAYAALLSMPIDAKMAVTTNLNVSFLRASPEGQTIVQEARVMKPGKRLSVIVCEAFGADRTALAHATMTYAMPTVSPVA
ncbi:PaaI family thioesterase [Acuticoccus sp. M5D2P5]|uniref:PaaI family thioesterase n=1 Tax=Acuticoccus kalidii TaxID=2910977 RepID=UPI001F22823A|nr:PaaI family thioesterase [Acuticoccus kalidii]MCF3932361.1 PaaI family thioesterase [Acuticoccus kalidii]